MSKKTVFEGRLSQRQLLRRRLWPAGLTALLFFLYEVLGTGVLLRATLLRLPAEGPEAVPEAVRHASLILDAAEYMGHSATALITMTVAVVLALQGFSWLFDRQAVDFYESQPVSRASHFRDITLNSLAIFLVSYAVSLLLGFGLCAVFGAMGKKVIISAGTMFLKNIFVFFASYALGTLAAVLTGNPIVSVLMAGVFLLYELVLRTMLNMLKAVYYETYPGNGLVAESLWTSPFYYVSGQFSTGGSILRNFLLGCVFLGLAVFAYHRRPNEAAGSAVVFRPVQTLVKVLVSFLGGLTMGFLFCEISGNAPGVLCGMFFAVIFGCIIQIIYEYNFKALFRHFPELIVTAALTCAVLLIFITDLTGYDTWVPEADKVADAAILFDDNWAEYYDQDGAYLGTQRDFAEACMHLTDTRSVTELAGYCVKDMQEREPDPETGAFIDTASAGGGRGYVTVLYRMKNGQKRMRRYALPVETPGSLLDPVIGTEEFRKGFFQVYKDDWALKAAENRKQVYLSFIEDADHNGETLWKTDYPRLREAYLKDLEQFDLSYLRGHDFLGMVSVRVFSDAAADPDMDPIDLFEARMYEPPEKTILLPVYEGFENTLSCLREDGIEPGPFTAEDLSGIRIYFNYEYADDETEYDAPELLYTEPEQIDAMLRAGIVDRGWWASPFSCLIPVEGFCAGDCIPASQDPARAAADQEEGYIESGVYYNYRTFYFRKGEAPEEIRKAFEPYMR